MHMYHAIMNTYKIHVHTTQRPVIVIHILVLVMYMCAAHYSYVCCFHVVCLSAASISSATFVRSHSRSLTFHTKLDYCCRLLAVMKLVRYPTENINCVLSFS